MKIYLDVCCFNRPFDDLEQERIKLEAEAVLIILNRCELTEWELISSDIIIEEIKQTPDLDKQKKLNQILSIANSKISFSKKIEKRSKELTALGFKTFDALHIAIAEEENVNILLTTDDRLLRKAITYANHLYKQKEKQKMKRTEIRKKGYEALIRELGIVGMIRFIQEFEAGSGDYTKERHQWLDQLSFEEVIESFKDNKNGEKEENF